MSRFSRRGLLASALAGAALMPIAAPARTYETDPLGGLSALDAFKRIRCAPEGERAYWWYSGHLLGRVEGQPGMPLLRVVGLSYSRTERGPDGSWRYRLTEAGYYGNHETGEIRDEWVNPLNGKTVQAVHYRSPQTLLFRPDMSIVPDMKTLPPGLDFTGRITRPDIKHGRIWMAEELFVKLPQRGDGPVRTANSLANFEASLADMISPALDFVPATMEYTTINSFRPWMEMGDTPGTISMRLNGMKMQNLEGAPADLVARIAAEHEGFFDEF